MHAVESLHRAGIFTQVLGQLLAPGGDEGQQLGAVVEVLVQVVGGGEELHTGVDQLQEIGPALIQPILPLSHGGRLRVPRVNKVLNGQVHPVHTFLPHAARLPRKFPKLLPQELHGGEKN